MSYRVLVPFDLPDANPVPQPVVDGLISTEVVVLGHYGLPEQTPPGAGREQFENAAREELTDLVRPLKNAGVSVNIRLAFSHTREEAIDDVFLNDNCDAILTTGSMDTLDQLFVALGGTPEFDRTLSFVAELLTAIDASVTLFHTNKETLATATDRLLEHGIEPNRIYQQVSLSSDVRQRVVDLEDEGELPVINETDSSKTYQLLRTSSISDIEDPAFIIRSSTQP